MAHADKILVSVVVLNWNGENLLRRFLPSVAANMPESAQLIIADNGSTDASLLYVRSEFPDIKIIAFSENFGFSEGYNRALAEISTPYTVLLNSDVEAKSDWITPMLEYMESHHETGACQPKILSEQNPGFFEYAGASGGFIDRHGYPYCRGRIFDTVEKDNGQYNSPISVFWASGAALMVRTRLYNEVGGLDTRFFAHMEEIDLCWRIRLRGYDIAAVPQARVYHLGGGSLPAQNPRKTYLNFRNNLLMLHKNLPAKTKPRLLLVRRLLDTIAWAKFVITFDFANAGAVFRAHRSFAKMRGFYNEFPEQNILWSFPNRKISILWQYFVKGRKNYNDL